MPQASEEQRARWQEPDGSIGEQRPVQYLTDRGYRLRSNWTWIKPTPEHEPTQTELDAIWYMVNEWDYGGIAAAVDNVIKRRV